jgi:hypothetical protein
MYIAINGEELVSAHRTYEGALVALMRYVGFTEKDIRKMRKIMKKTKKFMKRRL